MSKQDPQFKALSVEAQALHTRLVKEWSIRDAAGLITLLTACQALDRLREAQAMLKAEGIVVTGRAGPRPHPASTVERESRAGLLAALKSLSLDLESLEVDDAS